MNNRSARIAGWIPIGGKKVVAGQVPELGGLIDISRTGARLYLSWRIKVGDRLPLGLRVPGESAPHPFPCRVVWVKPDRAGLTEAFEARVQLLQELLHAGFKATSFVYGSLCGVKWEPEVSHEAIRTIQKHFEDTSMKPRKRVTLSAYHLPGKGGNPNLSLRPGY